MKQNLPDVVRKSVYKQLIAQRFKPDWVDLPVQNRRQASDLFAGVMRMQKRLDFDLEQLLQRMPPLKILWLLRMGYYELRFQDTPAYAVVSEYVNLAARFQPKSKALLNAVLRRATQFQFQVPADLATRYSHPEWLVEKWLKDFGVEETERFLQFNNQAPKHTVRINPLKESKESFLQRLHDLDIKWENAVWLDDTVALKNLQPLIAHQPIVQDEGAATVVRVVAPQKGMSVLDVCAAPGGKACYMATLMENEGRILALDRSEMRLKSVTEAAQQQGISIIETKAIDFLAFSTSERFDRILLDVPCSGTGVLAKRADLRWKRTPAQLAELVDLQQQLLMHAVQFLKPDGILIYSTCSVEREENQGQINAFLKANPAFESIPISTEIPAFLIENGHYVSFPPKSGFDGAFASKLRRKIAKT